MTVTHFAVYNASTAGTQRTEWQAVAASKTLAIGLDKLSAGEAWIGILAFSLQIYFDFSGYSDMAIGLGRMFGFEFLENFNHPYIAASITDFWRQIGRASCWGRV